MISSTAESLIQHYWSPVAPLFDADDVSDIYVYAWDRVAVRRRGEIELTAHRFENPEQLANALMHLAESLGLPLNNNHPMLDAVIPASRGDLRINAAIPPRSRAAHATIRLPSRRLLALSELLSNRTISPTAWPIIQAIVSGHLNFLISGTMGSGKTTLLRALIAEDPSGSTFVIEDTPELALAGHLPFLVEHHAPWTPAADAGVDPAVPSIMSALRSAPDRIILGEIRRAAQLYAYLSILATGTRGCGATIHASPGEGVLVRTRELLMQHAQFADPSAYRAFVTNQVQVLLHMAATPIGHRLTHAHWITGDQLLPLIERRQTREISHAKHIDRFLAETE